MRSEKHQQAALARLYELARREVSDALRLAQLDDTASIAAVLAEALPVIAGRYGIAAGVLACQWYDAVRDRAGVGGSFRAEPAPLPDRQRFEIMARWAASPSKELAAKRDSVDPQVWAAENRDRIEKLVDGGMHRVIANAHRESVMHSAWADPEAKGWARFGRGTSTCAFCLMLITRGAVYTDRTAKFGSHDHCDCGAGPVWKGAAGATTVDAYSKSARRREGANGAASGTTAADQARAREWIAANL